MGLRDKEQLAHQQLQLCTQSGSISWASAPFKEPKQNKHRTPLPKKLLYLPIISLVFHFISLLYKDTCHSMLCKLLPLSGPMSKANLLFKLFFFYNRNQMTTVDTLKFPVNRFIIAASSVWKYKQFPHLIIGRIWGSLTLPRQRIQCATAELCLVACVLSFLLFAFSRSPRLFPEIIKLIFPSKYTRELEERKWLQYKLFYFCRNGLKKKDKGMVSWVR